MYYIQPSADPQCTCTSKTSVVMGLLHNLGDGRRHTARAFAPWRSHRRGEIFMTAISRHGDTHCHLATCINLWRHPSPYGDTHRHMVTPIAIWRQVSQRRDGCENLITFCCPMLYLCCPRDGYRDVISAGLSRFGDPRHRSAICVAVPRQLSPFRDSCRATARHLVVQCKLSWPNASDSRCQGCAIGPIYHSSIAQWSTPHSALTTFSTLYGYNQYD